MYRTRPLIAIGWLLLTVSAAPTAAQAQQVYRIVGPDEADVRAGRLSVESPLARALLGKEVGESVVVERPRGAVEYTVTQVDYVTQ